MNGHAALLLASVFALSACEEKKEIVVTETREATSRDLKPKLSASSDERFRDTRPSPVKGETPEGWLELPGTEFRLLNYRFGESGTGEVWVTLASGTVLDNANRWLGQFGAKPLDPAGLAALRSVPIAGTTGTWVETTGSYAGMGAEPRAGFALAGVIAAVNGRILTVKMIGPESEVKAAAPVLESFVKGLKLAD